MRQSVLAPRNAPQQKFLCVYSGKKREEAHIWARRANAECACCPLHEIGLVSSAWLVILYLGKISSFIWHLRHIMTVTRTQSGKTPRSVSSMGNRPECERYFILQASNALTSP